jgi:Lrp/AsnC family leucine-responsive transcriptional regulator
MDRIIGDIALRPKSDLTARHLDEIIFRTVAAELDEIDVQLVRALQEDADRPNVQLAKLVGLSPAATLHRVRRLKESGVITTITALVSPAAAGLTLQVYVAVTLARHDDAAHRRFVDTVLALPEIVEADWVTGETDALLVIAARDVAELQRVLLRLSSRGGAQRLMTLLRLEELKPRSPLPVRATR